MITQLLTAPTNTVVSIDELKRQLRLETEPGDWDTMLDTYINATTITFEQLTGLVLMRSTFVAITNRVESEMLLKGCPVVEIISVQYYNADNVLTTMPVSDYEPVLSSIPAFVKFKSLPAVADRFDAVTITYCAGYADAKQVPADIRTAILVGAASQYERPVDSVQQLPSVFYNIVNNNKKWIR